MTFCGVVRPDDHPARPAGYVPLDAFWTKRGYRRALVAGEVDRTGLRALRDGGEMRNDADWARQAGAAARVEIVDLR